MTAMTTERRRWTSISDLLLIRVQGDQNQVDEFDEDERHDHATDAVDPHVAAQDRRRTGRAELDAAKRQGNQSDDDQRIEDDGGEYGALGAVEVHDVQGLQWSIVPEHVRAGKECRNDGEVFGDVIR